jgi:hypothetical protein
MRKKYCFLNDRGANTREKKKNNGDMPVGGKNKIKRNTHSSFAMTDKAISASIPIGRKDFRQSCLAV